MAWRLLVWSGCFVMHSGVAEYCQSLLPHVGIFVWRMILPEPIAVRALPRCIFVTVCGVRLVAIKHTEIGQKSLKMFFDI